MPQAKIYLKLLEDDMTLLPSFYSFLSNDEAEWYNNIW